MSTHVPDGYLRINDPLTGRLLFLYHPRKRVVAIRPHQRGKNRGEKLGATFIDLKVIEAAAAAGEEGAEGSD